MAHMIQTESQIAYNVELIFKGKDLGFLLVII